MHFLYLYCTNSIQDIRESRLVFITLNLLLMSLNFDVVKVLDKNANSTTFKKISSKIVACSMSILCFKYFDGVSKIC